MTKIHEESSQNFQPMISTALAMPKRGNLCDWVIKALMKTIFTCTVHMCEFFSPCNQNLMNKGRNDLMV